MTLFDIITTVNKQFPGISGEDICDIVNELEDKIISEIFSPHGIERPRPPLNAKTDINESLILENKHLSLYTYFIHSVLSLNELDFESANSFATAFNERFKELSISYRRENLPIKNTVLKGGI